MNAAASGKVDKPSEIVKVASLSEWRRHVAVLVVVCGLAREVDEACVGAELLLHSPRMLLCCTSLVGVVGRCPSRVLRTRVLLHGTLSLEMQPILVCLPIQPGSQRCRVECLHCETGQAAENWMF